MCSSDKKLGKAQQSRITNGKLFFDGVDGRTEKARRFRDIYLALVDELGGEENCNTSDLEMARAAAMLAMVGEHLQSRVCAGEDVDHLLLLRNANALRRQLAFLGLKNLNRKPEEKSLEAYLGERQAAKSNKN